MKHLSYRERAFLRGHLNRVRHVTLDPDGPGVVRIHLIPCTKPDRDTPFVAILNGQDILPLNLSWAILLTNLIEALQPLADDPAQFDYFVSIITSTMVGILTVWVEHGKTETEEQMVQKLAGAFAEMAILELPG